jgi:hypothetical protein
MATAWRIHVVHDANVRDTLRRIRSRSSCRSMSSLQESGMDPEPEDDEGAWDLFRFVRSALILVPIVAGAGAMMTLGIWREQVNLVSSEDCIHPTAVTVRACRYRDVFPTELMAPWLVASAALGAVATVGVVQAARRRRSSSLALIGAVFGVALSVALVSFVEGISRVPLVTAYVSFAGLSIVDEVFLRSGTSLDRASATVGLVALPAVLYGAAVGLLLLSG